MHFVATLAPPLYNEKTALALLHHNKISGADLIVTSIAVRKTFSGPGRPRKEGPRQPNGQLRRPPPNQQSADIIALVLDQPHRRGSRDQRRSTLIGRLVLDGIVRHDRIHRDQLIEAADRFAADYARFQRAVASRRPLAVTGGKVLVPDDPERDEREYRAAGEAWASVRRALRDAGERAEKAAHAAILDAAPEAEARSMAPWVVLSLPAALAALALYYGLSGRSPMGG